ncbi:uncharacterized protein J7T54_004976 [Emericellopsis cladophorae]|uniref:DUF2470 domain-containing protein n=1 Tax=Emericellopsis cladophorae TaxID=2686198 RepID=A0A9P9Y1U2_9HYPO|nr:uncharacterized protein J7T54_004976 [Emericellopsis cladophorae]KAI6781810.1 hypothetical protein J7T54_004976 [Emericellopsis cladophorae]
MSDEPSRQASIITHVNKDHQDSLRRYLQHFLAIHPVESDGPELTDVSFDRLLIRNGDTEHAVPFTPPLTSWSEIRGRFVAMDNEAKETLGEAEKNGIVIREYTPPEGFGIVVFTGVAFYFACYTFLDTITRPASTSHSLIQACYPGGVDWFRWLVKAIFWPVVTLHTGEAIGFDLTRLTPHGVRRGSALWLAWVANCWIEGYTSWKRIDKLIARKNAEQAKKR